MCLVGNMEEGGASEESRSPVPMSLFFFFFFYSLFQSVMEGQQVCVLFHWSPYLPCGMNHDNIEQGRCNCEVTGLCGELLMELSTFQTSLAPRNSMYIYISLISLLFILLYKPRQMYMKQLLCDRVALSIAQWSCNGVHPCQALALELSIQKFQYQMRAT